MVPGKPAAHDGRSEERRAVLTAAILLASRMLVVAAIVVSVSLVVARSGPVVGAMLATLPISTGPAYVFLALDHGADFIVRSTVASIIAVGATGVFLVAHILAARFGGTVTCLASALGACLASLVLADMVEWTLARAVAASALVMGAAIAGTGRARRAAAPFVSPGRLIDLVVRATAVMIVVATVTILGDLAGPRLAGYGAVIPVVFTSFIIVMQPRVGAAAIAGLFAHALIGIAGFIPAFLVLNVATRSLGVWWGLGLGLATSLAWNGVIILLQRYRFTRS
jgi:hypothetical protein